MFLDLDVVDFNDDNVPFVSILLNSALVRQVQPIDNTTQSHYTAGREKALEEQRDDPNVKVSPIMELPGQGAIIHMLSPHLGTYYTVTPYPEVKRQFLVVGRNTGDTNEAK